MSEPQNSRQKKLGDGVDMMLHYARIAQSRGEIGAVYDYPETVQNILKLFVKVWGIQEYSIPRKPKNGKGKWAEWINELQSLESVCGSNVEESLKSALDFYNENNMSFMIVRPASIINVVLEVKRRKQLKEKSKVENSMNNSVEENKAYVGGDDLEKIRKELFGE